MSKRIYIRMILAACVVLFVATPVFAAPAGVNAPIAIVMDFYTGEILYERNAQQRWIPASMTKSMAAFIAYQEIAAGNLTLQTEIKVSANAARFANDRRVAGSFVPMREGSYITVEMLLRLMMIPSANAASVVLGEHISGSEAAFVERMNATAAEMGMYTSFLNSHGAMVHHSDAYSMAVLVREFVRQFPDILRITRMPSVYFNGELYTNTNHLLHQMYMAGVDGFKTGSLRQAGWNHSTTATRDGRRLVAVVMNTPNNAARHNNSRALLNFGFDELERRETERAARVRVFFDGGLIPTSSAVVSRGQLMLPVRDVFERLGYNVTWLGEHRLVTLSRENESTITLFVDRNVVTANGRTFTMDAPTQTINGRIFISKELLAAVTNTTASWNIESGVVQFRRG